MKNKKYILFVLSGASGSGKSTLLKKVVENGLCEQAPKYSNREKRNGFDDITHVDNLEEICDIIYCRYNDIHYGFNSDEIKERLQYNNQMLIASDISAIKEIRNKFGNDVSTIFVYLQDLCIGNLLKERYTLNLNNEEIVILENHILECRRKRDINWFNLIDENIKTKIKDSFLDNLKYQEFVERCGSWISIEIDYENNKDLFRDTINGKKTEELYEIFYCQIFNKYVA